MWDIQKYKEVMDFIKKLCVCDKDIMWPDDIIIYGYLFQEGMCEYRNIVDSERWEPTGSKKKSQDEPLLIKAFTVEIKDPVNNTEEKVGFQIFHNVKYNNSRVG